VFASTCAFIGTVGFVFLFSHQGLFKKSGEKRKILDGLINISIHSFRLLCFFSLIPFPFGCSLSSLSLGSSCQRIWRTWDGGLLGCFNDLGALSGVAVLGFFNGAKLFYLLQQ